MKHLQRDSSKQWQMISSYVVNFYGTGCALAGDLAKVVRFRCYVVTMPFKRNSD
ncbi:hypothetical protein RG118_004592 [Providencia rettgeri]|nr:hypothetical protein [Providencia rettgeri]ELR5281402.1 hypothetical protein [Providencia rettgeri]